MINSIYYLAYCTQCDDTFSKICIKVSVRIKQVSYNDLSIQNRNQLYLLYRIDVQLIKHGHFEFYSIYIYTYIYIIQFYTKM